MAKDHALHKCVTEFMVDTCLYDTKTSYCALLSCLMRSLAMTADDCEVLSSGSSAEFYIEPMLPYVGDIDIMSCFNNCLAVPAGHTPPTQLPAHHERTVTVYEIIDSHQPGFVYLMPSCILEKNESGFYVVEMKIVSEHTPQFLPKPDIQATAKFVADKIQTLSHFPHHLKQNVHGPAVETGVIGNVIQAASRYYRHNKFVADVETRKQCWCYDYVLCMRCRCWPLQAADWPSRIRYYGVPDQTSINVVVSNGCDLVGVVHPRCRQDEWMNKHQWRLSFSRAEVTLLNSWTPVQQIIYHMLRYVLKCKGLSVTDDKEQKFPKLSNYHIKTLMLWECEQKPQSWWSAESSLIKLCSSLLQKLSDWVEHKHCQHYFISNCNLLNHVQDASLTICYDLRCLSDSSVLLTWFIRNYIRECAEYCPRKVNALFESSRLNERAIRAVVDWKLNSPCALSNACNMCEWLILYHFQEFHEVAKLTQARVTELRKFDSRVCDYFVAVTSLHIAFTVSIHFLTEDLLEELRILFDPTNPISAADDYMATSRFESGGLLYIRTAIKLATLSSFRTSALEMLHNEMSKAYLHHSFVCGQESTCIVHVLLATLYYKSGHYQTAIDHCKQVLNQCDREKCGSRHIGTEYLPQIDENVDAVFGLVLLYQYVQRHAVNSDNVIPLEENPSYRTRGSGHTLRDAAGKRPLGGCLAPTSGQEPCSFFPVAVTEPKNLRLPIFTTHSLARYLYFTCSTAVTIKFGIVKFYKQHLLQTKHPLLNDVFLFRFMEMQLCECTEKTVGEDLTQDDGNNVSISMDTTRLVKTLELVALENLMKSRQVVVREMHCRNIRHVNEFEALYAYKRGLFEECIKICRRHIDVLGSAICIQHYFVAYPEMLSLLDGELVSIFGIIRLLRPNFLFESAYNSRLDEEIHMPTLSLYLIVCCQRNLRSNSLDDTMNTMRGLHNQMYPANRHFFLDRVILRLIYRSLRLHMKTRQC